MTPNPERCLETRRLILRPMRLSDFDSLLRIFTDPKVMAAFDCPPFDDQQMGRWLQRNLDHQAEHGYGLFSVLLKADNGANSVDDLIGDCGLEMMDLEGGEAAELGYDFRSDCWNQGLASEAAAAVRDYAFHELGLPQLVSLIRVGNAASRRVAEKTGMQLVAEFERYGYRYWKYAMLANSASRPETNQPCG